MESNSTGYCTHIDNKIVIGNSFIERIWDISPLGLVSRCVFNKKANCKYENLGDEPDFQYEGLTFNKYKPFSFHKFDLVEIRQEYSEISIYANRNLEVTVYLINKQHGIELKHHLIVYESAPAIKIYTEILSFNIPMGEFFNEDRINCIDKISFTRDHKLKSVEFFTRTDNTNDLVHENYNCNGFDKGNILIASSNDNGFFVLKESPCYFDQRKECAGNFKIEDCIIKVLGTGLRPEEISDSNFRKTYASIVGVYNGDITDGFVSLKKFQAEAYLLDSLQHNFIMANPWGDRKCLQHMCEEFVIQELLACDRLGITHYQIDDGWQKGKAFKRMNNMEKLEDDYWDIDIEKFPEGFDNIVKLAKNLGITLALWYAPNFNNLYKNINKEIDILHNMYFKYGISIFKIDGVKLRNKDTEERIELMLRTLRDLSNGRIYFNLDLTADPRSGYFMFLEYGNLFLENRYIAWGNYFPCLTLRNLWDLSMYVPTKRLQVEFLNLSLNMEKYIISDDSDKVVSLLNDNERNICPKNNVCYNPLAPNNYTYEYIFAITMFASPLAWCEVSKLDNYAIECLKVMIALYNHHKDDINKGDVFPIGNRPDGHSFTGFQSHNHAEGTGYLLMFRENNNDETFKYKLNFLKSKNIKAQKIYPATKDILQNSDNNNYNINSKDKYFLDNGQIIINIDKPNSFILLKYKI